MKKFVFGVLVMAMMLMMATSALATSFTLNVPCEAIADDQLYRYHYDRYEVEQNGDSKIYVSHRVTQIDAVETNRIAAFCQQTQKTMGANWHRADSGKYQCMSNAIINNNSYTVAGRGNTNYLSKYGLSSITLSGYFLAN